MYLSVTDPPNRAWIMDSEKIRLREAGDAYVQNVALWFWHDNASRPWYEDRLPMQVHKYGFPQPRKLGMIIVKIEWSNSEGHMPHHTIYWLQWTNPWVDLCGEWLQKECEGGEGTLGPRKLGQEVIQQKLKWRKMETITTPFPWILANAYILRTSVLLLVWLEHWSV